MSFFLLGFLLLSSASLAQLNAFKDSNTVAASSVLKTDEVADTDLFFSKGEALAVETPDLKLVQDNFVAGIAAPNILTTQTLGAIFGEPVQERKDVVDYQVQPGDTIASVAAQYGLKPETIWANNGLSKNSSLKVGDNLTILPTDGVLYLVKSGDTVSDIAKKYKASAGDIVSFNSLANEGDIFIGDALIIPGGKMPAASSIQNIAVVPDSFFIFPLLRFKVTQGLHYYNGVDIASLDGAGSPVYAAADGTVLRAGYDRVGGNRVTILHSNGVVTYYGHLNTMFVAPGDKVVVGQKIGTEGQTGDATGPHVHFQVMGATNFIAVRYPVGSVVDVTKK